MNGRVQGAPQAASTLCVRALRIGVRCRQADTGLLARDTRVPLSRRDASRAYRPLCTGVATRIRERLREVGVVRVEARSRPLCGIRTLPNKASAHLIDKEVVDQPRVLRESGERAHEPLCPRTEEDAPAQNHARTDRGRARRSF